MIENTSCYLCNSDQYHVIHQGVRAADHVDVLECDECGLVRLSSFQGVSDEFYSDSKMHSKPVSLEQMRKAAKEDDERRYKFLEKMIENKRVLDFGCGSGGFLARAKHIASKVAGIELEEKMRSALQDEGIECYNSLSRAEQSRAEQSRAEQSRAEQSRAEQSRAEQSRAEQDFDVITLFHVLEHLDDPCAILGALKDKLTEDGIIVIEVPNADDALLKLYQSQAFADFTYWMCHLYLYNNHTLSRLAQKCGFKIRFMKQIQRYPLSNHLYWLSKNRPGGHCKWSFLGTQSLDRQYGDLLANLGMGDTIIAVLEK